MSPERTFRLREALAAGRLSKTGYLLAMMRLVEEEADQIIQATPQNQSARLLLQADDQRATRPKQLHRTHHPQD
jgi:hypothetical protein